MRGDTNQPITPLKPQCTAEKKATTCSNSISRRYLLESQSLPQRKQDSTCFLPPKILFGDSLPDSCRVTLCRALGFLVFAHKHWDLGVKPWIRWYYSDNCSLNKRVWMSKNPKELVSNNDILAPWRMNEGDLWGQRWLLLASQTTACGLATAVDSGRRGGAGRAAHTPPWRGSRSTGMGEKMGGVVRAGRARGGWEKQREKCRNHNSSEHREWAQPRGEMGA